MNVCDRNEMRALLEKHFLLTETHFTDCAFSLEQLAAMTGYDYSYVSKYFLQKTGIRYGDYLTQRRIFLAAKLLQRNASDRICDIAFACGYGNVRSFNRNFKKHWFRLQITAKHDTWYFI